MDIRKIYKSRKKNLLDFKKSILTIALLSLLTVLCQIFVQNGINIFSYIGYGTSPLILVFNFLPIFLVMLLGYFIFNRIWAGYLLINIPLGALLIINHYKIVFRDEPLKPVDLLLGSEASNIIQNYDVRFDFKCFLITFVIIASAVLIALFLKSKKTNIFIRFIGIVLSVALMFGLYTFVYSDNTFFRNVPSNASEYYDVSISNYKGFIFTFLSNISNSIYAQPDGYSKEAVDAVIEKYSDELTSSDEMPDVIGIMSEAFFDPRVADNMNFYNGMNPLENFDRLRNEGYYGNITVPGFAGSTASTEFEFLSGMNISLISDTMPMVYKTYINRDCFSLARMFKELGYDTLALHPGHKWFYNRNTVYARMGFDNFIGIEDLPDDLDEVNYYTADSETSKLIIEHYKEHMADSTKKYFNFTVTIQNHGPYMDYETERPPRYVRPEGISDKLYNVINNYTDGLYDADKLLGDVADYLSTVDRPVVLIFFGDHLPYFDEAFAGYRFIGYDVNEGSLESVKNRYKIPYVIWCNDAAKEQAKKYGRNILTGKGRDISSNFLASEMFDVLGIKPSPYFAYVGDLKKKISVISTEYNTVGEKDIERAKLSDETKDMLEEYKSVQYHYLKKYSK